MPAPPRAVTALYTELALAADLRRGLAARRLDEKFLYASSLSAEAWVRLCRSEGYPNHRRSLAMLERRLGPVLAGVAGPVHAVSLGPGDGSKDALVAARLAPEGYTLVDVSQALLEAAWERLPRAAAVKADCCDPAQLAAAAAGVPGTRLWVILGGTLGGWEPEAFLRALAGAMGPGDALLFDGEAPHDGVLAAYDNPDNRAFALTPFRSLGVRDGEGRVEFELESAGSGVVLIRKRFRALRHIPLVTGDALPEGASVELSRVVKWDRAAWEAALGGAGLRPLAWEEDGPWFLALLRKEP